MKIIYAGKTTRLDATIDLDSNVAIASVSAQGTDTFVGVDAAAIVVEDPLSESTVMITSEVG